MEQPFANPFQVRAWAGPRLKWGTGESWHLALTLFPFQIPSLHLVLANDLCWLPVITDNTSSLQGWLSFKETSEGKLLVAAALGEAHRGLCWPVTSPPSRKDRHSRAQSDWRSESIGLRVRADTLMMTNVTQELRKFKSTSWNSSRTNPV